MQNDKVTRKPIQKRALEKKNKILKTAKYLFSEKNYFVVSTNEIAKEAGISIGTLYSYYASKEEILTDLVKEYNDSFYVIFERINTSESFEQFKQDTITWLRELLVQLTEVEDKEFHLQIEMLAASIPEVRSVVKEHKEKMQHLTYEHFLYYANQTDTETMEVLAVILFDFISALVDEVLYTEHSKKEQDKLREQGIQAIDLLIKQYIV
ncbi:TetR/AcrR family transcriptional regulator [Enterococcus sp. HY326]|uniref:TetR/AcrR family transcriptional regulator n=1 Tax=Enterococcus sp. HY326 TaxID=2971265 RepID=UPI00223F8021|nr:TetR/AcrR family transcriptional regulator [Enterococcus sp. HY326]